MLKTTRHMIGKIQLVSGYNLTSTRRKALSQMIQKGIQNGKAGRTLYRILNCSRSSGFDRYDALSISNERDVCGRLTAMEDRFTFFVYNP